mgnify:CR=1 FL=1
MKAIKFLMVLAVMVSAFTFNAQAQNKKKKGVEEAKFSVYLHCNDEKKKAEAVIPTIKGIKDMKASVEEQSLWIKYDPNKISKEALMEALNKKGFPVKDFKAGAADTHHESCDDHDHDHNHDHKAEHKHDHKHDHKH